jgi:septum formation protein
MTIILASGSPRRRDLLGRLGVPFEVVPSAVIEPDPEEGEDPATYALSLARRKAEDVASRYADRVVLGADTIVAVDGQILVKPLDKEDAVRMLSALAGRDHTVITAVALRGRCDAEGMEQAVVRMHAAAGPELRAYVATGEPMDKAGGYGIQGKGGALVESVHGCFETVVGLPLCLVSRLLRECGVTVTTGQICRHLG